MPRNRPGWTHRQREQLRHLANYVEYLKEKVAQFEAADKPLPKLIADAIRLLPAVKKRIEKDDFDSPAELWREVENRIVEWYIQESKHWKPPRRGPRPGSRPS